MKAYCALPSPPCATNFPEGNYLLCEITPFQWEKGFNQLPAVDVSHGHFHGPSPEREMPSQIQCSTCHCVRTETALHQKSTVVSYCLRETLLVSPTYKHVRKRKKKVVFKMLIISNKLEPHFRTGRWKDALYCLELLHLCIQKHSTLNHRHLL